MRLYFYLSILVLASCKTPSKKEIHQEWGTYFDKWKLDGSMVVYDLKNDNYYFYNPDQYTQEFSPASTFKIFNTMVGLETGVIKNEDFVIDWDSIVRQNPKWNQNTDLKMAFKNSTVWYYQELARRVGQEKMQYWINKVGYGNKNIGGGIDRFWLNGQLRITPEQQIQFLKSIYQNELPFSKRSIDILKKIMIEKDTLNYFIRSKTGMADNEHGHAVGWYVGYIEKKDNVFFFATCIQTDAENPDFKRARKDISREILLSLDIID